MRERSDVGDLDKLLGQGGVEERRIVALYCEVDAGVPESGHGVVIDR